MRLLTLLCCCSLLACEGAADPLDFVRRDTPIFKAHALHPTPPTGPKTLKVVAWNVKYGACRVDFWFDFWGDRVQLSTTEVTDCLSKIATLIKEVDPDILMAEEIEAGSKRSAYVDMVRYLLENTNLNYATYVQTWASRYVPSEGVGRIDLGNAIFSKYRITKAEAIRQQDRTDQDPITKSFYIHRAIGRAEIDLGDRTIAAFVVHTEAYDQDGTKQKQIKQIYDTLAGEKLQWVIGGDFNELPAVCDEKAAVGAEASCVGKLRLSGFIDERASSKGTAYEQPPYTPSVMKPFYDDFNPYISLARYGTREDEQRRYFTHSVLGPDGVNDEGQQGYWNRTLDYLFVRKGETWVQSDVLQEKGRLGLESDPIRLSDHAPVLGVWEVAR